MSVKTGVYRHYKGRLYEVLGVAQHSETHDELVVYRALYGRSVGQRTLWVRPKRMFCERIIVDGAKQSRFEFLRPSRTGMRKPSRG
jgi:hypothetical protein